MDSSGLCFFIFAEDSKPRVQRASWGWLRFALKSRLSIPLGSLWDSCWWVLFSPRITRGLIHTYCYARLEVMYIETKLKGETWTFIILSFYWDLYLFYQSTKVKPSQLPLSYGVLHLSCAHFQLPLPGPLALKLLLWSIHILQNSFPQLVLGFDKGISPESLTFSNHSNQPCSLWRSSPEHKSL